MQCKVRPIFSGILSENIDKRVRMKYMVGSKYSNMLYKNIQMNLTYGWRCVCQDIITSKGSKVEGSVSSILTCYIRIYR